MAHVLLPCDLPTWVDVQRHLAQLMTCKDAAQMSQVMAKIYEICCISLDPDEQQPAKEHDGFQQLRRFVEEVLGVEERSKFLETTLPAIVAHALSLRSVKPTTGFLYSLKKEDETFELERRFVVSLLANAFLNTFPKRNSKTHPTLQDFSFTDFFAHLGNRNHQRKLRSFLKYFDAVETKPTGCVKFTRKGVSGPSLPGWLCSNRPLVPLIVRHEGDVHEAEPQLLRACSCSALIGGDVLKSASSQEANLFFSFPELLVCLSFVECLGDNEALVAEGINNSTGSDRGSSAQNCWSSSESQFCLLDSAELRDEPGRQFGDGSLWRELNKALAAFTHDPHIPPVPDIAPKQRRQTPVGESSSSDAASHRSLSKLDASSNGSREPRGGRISSRDPYEGRPVVKVPPITKLPPSDEILDTIHRRRHSLNDSKATPWHRLSGQQSNKSATSLFKKSHSAQSSGKMSLRTASQSSVELPPIHPLPEEEFYTADEDSGEGSESHSKSSHRGSSKRKDKRTSVAMTDLLKEDLDIGSSRKKSSAKHINRESSSEVSRESRSGSAGFVLGDSEEESEPWAGQEEHERLDDFRRRIRKRTRRRASRRSSRSSHSAGSGSSDMEDISEDPELAPPRGALRPASSEPSLLTAAAQHAGSESAAPFRLSDEAALLCLGGGGRKLMVTSSHGQPKAYSYDGVSPNLPVPFRAAFRRRRLEQGQSRSLDADMDFLWSASMAERSSSQDDLSSCSRTGQSLELVSAECPGGVRPWKRWPVAAEPRARPGEDPQLKALVLWLAASLADVPFLILYAAREPELNELNSVYSQVLHRHWSVGDLSCEVLRFCRNKSRRRTCLGLFGQLLGKEAPPKSSLTYNLSQQSLD